VSWWGWVGDSRYTIPFGIEHTVTAPDDDDGTGIGALANAGGDRSVDGGESPGALCREGDRADECGECDRQHQRGLHWTRSGPGGTE